MTKIIVTQELDLTPEQLARLKQLGETTVYDNLASNYDDWLKRVEGFDVICSGKFGLKQKIHELHDVLISVPFVGVGFADPEILKQHNVTLANSPGCNKEAVSEWIVGMVINLRRLLPDYINNTEYAVSPSSAHEPGLMNAKLVILGHGNIAQTVGSICEQLKLNVDYFRRGDNIYQKVANADIVVNTLPQNEETEGLFNQKFFSALQDGVYFVSVGDRSLFSETALLEALDSGKIEKAAIDCMGIQVGDIADAYFQRLAAHPRVYATPHIAYKAISSAVVGNDMMIDNIERWLAGNKPR